MKHTLPFIFFLLSLGACKKTPTGSSIVYPLDTAIIEFKVNGVQYNQTYTTSSNPNSGHAYAEGSLVPLDGPGHYSAVPEYNYTLYMQKGALFIDIRINGDTSTTRLLPGVFIYNPKQIDSTNHFATAYYWGELQTPAASFGYPLSDTVTITDVNNEFASGTFTATFERQVLYPGQDTLSRITDGLFKNLPVY